MTNCWLLLLLVKLFVTLISENSGLFKKGQTYHPSPERACTFPDRIWDWLKKKRNNDTIAMSPKTIDVRDKRTNQNTGLEEVQDYSSSPLRKKATDTNIETNLV